MEQGKAKVLFRMSEAGKCPRALTAQLQGYEAEAVPDWLETAAKEGNHHEKIIKDDLTNEGLYIYDEQLEVTIPHPSFTLVGHIDGKVIEELEGHSSVSEMLLEVKSMSQFEFDRWMKGRFEAFPNYADQVTCYMEATKLDKCLYIVKNRSSGYIDRKVLTQPPSDITNIIIKLRSIVNAKGLIPVEYDSQSIECRRCSYKALCVPEPKELTPVEEKELEKAVKYYITGKDMVESGQKLVDDAKEVFTRHTKATGTNKWKFRNLIIQMIHNKRESYDKKILLEIFTPEQLSPALKVSEYDSLRIDPLDNGGSNDK